MPFFLGREQPPAPTTTSAQKCLRTVGHRRRRPRHVPPDRSSRCWATSRSASTSRRGAIEYASEFVQRALKLDRDRIWVSVHAGDPELKLGPDEDGDRRLWKRIGVPPERIVPLPSTENFWSVGGPGPCGPDSEIYYDCGEEAGCGAADCQPGCTAASASSSSGTSSSWRTSCTRTATLVPTCRRRTSTPAWASSARRGSSRSVAVGLRHRRLPADHGVDRSEVRRRIRRDGRRDEGAPRARRPRARHHVPVADGVTPVERGPRLRPAAASSGARCSTACASGSRAVLPARRHVVDRADGRRVSGAARASPPRSSAVVAAEEERFARDARARHEGVRGARPAQRRDHGRGRVHARRDLRLPDRADRRSSRDERGQAVDVDGFRELMEGHREISRAGGESATAQRRRASSSAPASDDRVRRLREDRRADRSDRRVEPLGDGTLPVAKLERVAVLPRRRRPGDATPASSREADGARLELVEALRLGDDQVLVFERRRALRSGRPRPRRSSTWSVRFPTMANHTATHLLHAGAARGARRPREAGRARRCVPTSSASTSRTRRRSPRRSATRGRAARERAACSRTSPCASS